MVDVWGGGGLVGPGAEGGGELGYYDADVADDAEFGVAGVAAYFFGGDVHLDELSGGIPLGGVAEV